MRASINYRFVPTNQVLSPQELLNRAHRLRTIGGDNYINAQNGFFISNDGKHKLSLNQIYRITLAVFSTDRKCFAKRKNQSSPLIKGYMRRK